MKTAIALLCSLAAIAGSEKTVEFNGARYVVGGTVRGAKCTPLFTLVVTEFRTAATETVAGDFIYVGGTISANLDAKGKEAMISFTAYAEGSYANGVMQIWHSKPFTTTVTLAGQDKPVRWFVIVPEVEIKGTQYTVSASFVSPKRAEPRQ